MRIKGPDGRVHETVKEAAEFYNVTENTVYDAVARRTTKTLGIGRGKTPGHASFNRDGPFNFAGHSWPSMRACSRDTKIPYWVFTAAFKSFEEKRTSVETMLKRKLRLLTRVEKALQKRERNR